MRPSAWFLCGLLAASLLSLGCEAKKPKDDQQTSMVDMKYDTLEPSSESYDETYTASDDGMTADGMSSTAGGNVYVVRPKDTLYSIARAHYGGDHTKWKLIYEANRERISDPNRIAVGMKLIIPPDTVQ